MFWDLHATRGGGFGAAAISHAEMLAWQQLYNVELLPWEVEIIRALDRAVLVILSEEN